jgi:catechol 2,3-dioxygenase-like lactoylglutathione lyase family enzyme
LTTESTATSGPERSGRATVAEIVVAADPGAWRAAGFRVDDDTARVGTVALRLVGAAAGKRIVRCALRDVDSERLDGLPIIRTSAQPPDGPAPRHPNGVVGIDHLVAFTPDLDRTVAAAEAIGLDLRRVREQPAPAGSPRQAFFRLGELILEVAQAPAGSPLAGDDPARFYGLALLVDDLDAAVAALGDHVGEPRDAVQAGRRIATIRHGAELGLPVALMSPRPSSGLGLGTSRATPV